MQALDGPLSCLQSGGDQGRQEVEGPEYEGLHGKAQVSPLLGRRRGIDGLTLCCIVLCCYSRGLCDSTASAQ